MIPAPTGAEPAAASPAQGDEAEEAEEKADPGKKAVSFKKFHVYLGGGAGMLVSPAGASDLFGSGYIGDLRFIYHINPKIGFHLDFSAQGHVYITPDEGLPGGYTKTTSAGALAMVQTGLGGRYVIGGLAGKSVAPYVQGELVFTSAGLAYGSSTTVDVNGNTISTSASAAAVADTGMGAGIAGGLALGKKFGAFLELGYRASGVDISSIRILAGLKF